MRALFPLFMTALLLVGFVMGDNAPLLNAYELARESGLAFLPESGTRYIADQQKLGAAALPAAWSAWIICSALLAFLATRAWQLIR